MNEIVNKFLLVGDKFVPEMHLRESGFTYSACGLFTKNKERIQRFKETGDTSYIYKNELDKACFQHDMAYGDFKDLTKRTMVDKVLRDKALKIATDQKYGGYQRYGTNFLTKSHMEVVVLCKMLIIIMNIYNWQMNFINQLLENLKKEKCIFHLETISGV